MTIDELLIAHGDIVPVNGHYATELRQGPGATVWEAPAVPMRAVFPTGVTPRGYVPGRGVRDLRLSPAR